MKTTLFGLLIAIGLCSGCTTSYIHRPVGYNPLPAMNTYAQANGYNVQKSDANYLRVRKNVNWGSLLLARRDRFVGEYNYTDGYFVANVWLEQRGLFGLFPLAIKSELKPQYVGWAVTPSPRRCSEEMLKAGGMPPEWP